MKHYTSNDEQPGSLDRNMSSQFKQDYDHDPAHADHSSTAIASVMDRLGLSHADASPAISMAQLAADLSHTEWSVRVAAAQHLGNLPPQREAFTLLSQALKDENGYVRAAAARSLSKQGSRAVPPLIRALNDQEWTVRAGAALALGHLAGD